MELNGARWKFCRIAILLIAMPLVPCVSSAADHYVCSAATGAGDGSNWTNAYTALPSSLARGDTYWVAAGNYGSHTFNDAVNGSLVITVKAATDANHGASSTGWTNGSTGTCHQGQAVFTSPFTINTSFYTIDGSYRGAGNDSASYGFQVNNKQTGGNIPIVNGTKPLFLHGSNLIIQYLDYSGSHDRSNTYCDRGLWLDGGQSNNYLGFSHLHDTGEVPLVVDSQNTSSGGSTIIEHNWLERNQSAPACHAEGMALRPISAMNNLSVRFNYVENMEGTAWIGTPITGNMTSNNWSIYGNVFWYNDAEASCYGPTGCQSAKGIGDGLIDLFGNTTWNGVYVYNNTFANCTKGPGTVTFGAGWTSNASNVFIQNNIWYKCGSTAWQNSGSGSVTVNVSDHNDFDSSNPFVNVSSGASPGASGADNFHLSADTSAWFSLSSPYNADPDGLTRITSRGAFQFAGATSTLPAPPTGLTAVVH
jgi:hypothetical protein